MHTASRRLIPIPRRRPRPEATQAPQPSTPSQSTPSKAAPPAPTQPAPTPPTVTKTSEINCEQAQHGLAMIKQAIVNLLYRKRHGMTNAEICRELALASGQDGKGRNLLSWSILGILVSEGRLRKSGRHYFLA